MREYLHEGVAAGDQGDDPPHDLPLLRAARRVPHRARTSAACKLQKLSGSQINALYAKLAETGKKDGKSGLSPLSIRHVHACLHRACKDAVRWGRLARNPVEAADPPTHAAATAPAR